MKRVIASYGRAFITQFNLKMIILSLVPSILALVVWVTILFFSLQPLIDFLQQRYVDTNAYQMVSEMLTFLGLLALKAFIVPLVAMWLLLPIMLFTALIFVAFIAMPMINRIVGKKYFPDLERKYGAGWWHSVGYAFLCLIAFLFAWLLTIPMTLFFHLGMIVQPVLVGWLTYRVMAYDSLARHADTQERKSILKQHRWQLWLVGIITGLAGGIPGLLWLGAPGVILLGGGFGVYILPFMAAVAIWIFVLIFMFSGIWFQIFCLDALRHLRAHTDPAQ